MTAQVRVKLENLTLGYEGHPAVHHVTGAFDAGSMTAIFGPNGSGKSTLLKGLMGMLKPLGGSIEWQNLDVRDIAYLPQAHEIDRSFPATVHEIVSLGLIRSRGFFSAIGKDDRRQIDSALEAVGLRGFDNRPIGSLSGGQLQRSLFARALLQEARVILLDEPFSAIDAKTTSDLLRLIHRWHSERRTIVAVLHDADLIREHFPRSLVLAREPVAWGDSDDAMSADNLLRARHMNEAWDESAIWCGDQAA